MNSPRLEGVYHALPGQVKNLIQQIVDPANLKDAREQVIKNDGVPGVDGLTCSDLKLTAEQLLSDLVQDLRSGNYQPSPVLQKMIPKRPTPADLAAQKSRKYRPLGIPTTRDRWAQTAINITLTNCLDRLFSDSSHGFRPKRGTWSAILAARTCVEEGRIWVLKIDIRKFFDRVDHSKLLRLLAKTVPCEIVLRLVRKFITAPVQLPNGQLRATRLGCPQGGPLCPLLANLYLHPLDRWLEGRLVAVRYADDLQVFFSSEKAARRAKRDIGAFLSDRLALEINPSKSTIDLPERSPILGFLLWRDPTRQKVGITISHDKAEKYLAGLDDILREKTDDSPEKIQDRIKGEVGYYNQERLREFLVDPSGLFRQIDDKIHQVWRKLKLVEEIPHLLQTA